MPANQYKIFACPKCSLRVSGLEKACPRCGEAFDRDTKLECPFCGTLVLPTSTSCPSCQIVYSELHSRMEERLWDKAVDKIIDELDEIAEADAVDLICHKCNSTLKSPRARCEECGYSPSEATDVTTRAAEERKASAKEAEPPAEDAEAVCPICDSVVGLDALACPNCGAEFLLEEEVPEGEEEDEVIYCPACNGVVDLDVEKCPHCGAEFDEGEDLGIPPPPEETRAPEVARPEAGAERQVREVGHAEITTAAPAIRTRDPRGLSNGTSAVNGVSITNGRGVINGKSRVNGVHLTNGFGATNGRDMINGTGLPRGEAGRLRVPLGRKGIAVLMAIVIVISAFIYISLSREGSPYEVDGNFDEWDDAMMFTMSTESPSPDSNVLEWAASTYESQLNVYARVEGLLMSSSTAQRLMFFVDADDDRSTGYLVGDIGADFMLEILGCNDTIATSSLYEFASTRDPLDWNLWRPRGTVQCGLSGYGLEAMAQLPVQLDDASRVILVSQDGDGTQCTSYPIVLSGDLLVVEQNLVSDIAVSGILPSSGNEEFLQLRFTCQGGSGSVESVTPEMVGVDSVDTIAGFDLEPGQSHTISVAVDSSDTLRGQFVSATLEESGVTSSFSKTLVIGNGARAYCISPPEDISIDGAFADWNNRSIADTDNLPISNSNVNIESVGVDNSPDNSYFYISVFGEICSGVYVPKDCRIYTGVGGGTPIITRKTAEDFARIFIDSDRTAATGKTVAIGASTIGADFMIEVGGSCGEIQSRNAYSYSSGVWVEEDIPILAAKDSSRMEIGLITSTIGSPANMDFIIETTDWTGNRDLATNETVAGMKGWIVEAEADVDSTSMSYQRKLFYDGTNFWSIYYNGTTTAYKYSSDGGETWSLGGDVFSTSGIMDASLWYDSGDQIVYAVGDKSTPSQNVYLQRGSVNPGAHTITWAGSDSTLSVSSVSVGGKNAFICRDASEYLWILSSRQTGSDPDKFDLVAYISDETDSISSGWTEDTTMLSPDSGNGDLKGSILPAGSGSDVWVVYNRDSYVDARKRTSGSWGDVENVYTDTGSLEFINTAPASAVIDANGVVHVVYGDATKSGQTEYPQIQYKYRSSSGWSSAEELDADDTTVGHRYPTISLETSTGNLYALWVSLDDNNIDCKKNESGSWSFVTLGGQNSNAKLNLTSIYSVSGESQICWQWTQNTTGDVEVIFDVIPEFQELLVPILIIIAIFIVGIRKRRNRLCIDE